MEGESFRKWSILLFWICKHLENSDINLKLTVRTSLIHSRLTKHALLSAPRKTTHRLFRWSGNSTSGYVPQRIRSRVSKRYLYMRVHSSSTHSSQKGAATLASMDGGTDRQNVVYPCNGLLFGLKKERNSDTCSTWMKPEDMVLNEINQSQKDK